MITPIDIQKRISEAITLSNFTQKEIAKQLGVSQQTISHYKNGDIMPSINVLANLCKILDIDANYILCITDEY